MPPHPVTFSVLTIPHSATIHAYYLLHQSPSTYYRIIHMATHYEILGLPASSTGSKSLTPALIKAAYRRSLLQYHPDKLSNSDSVLTSTKPANLKCSIDQISTAYATLSVAKLRQEYDRELALSSQERKKEGESFRTGVEMVDLDDLMYEEIGDEMIWYRSCRCGDDRGFLVKAEDLEEASSDGELYTGCGGCSLWLKVLFDVIEDAEEETKES